MPQFIDRVTVNVTAGTGGNGCASILREKFRPMGGPDGGNGGHGGSIIFQVSDNVHTLLDMHFHPHLKADNGKPGQGGNRTGASGQNLIVYVPSGTVIFDNNRQFLADLTGAGTQFIVAQGGTGGLGNAALASRTRKAPGFALLGEEGQHRQLIVELKSVADIGLLGFPSAGKSSLISVVSAAKPKIADYPFTTLAPNLGVVSASNTSFTIADVPGLIPGAAQGKGLGLEFLRHIERCAVLAHVVDCATFDPTRDPVSDIEAIETELSSYQPELSLDTGLGDLCNRPRIIILNKTDIPDGAQMAEIVIEQLSKFGWPIFPISALTHKGLNNLLHALASIVTEHRATIEPVARPRITLVNDNNDTFTITRDPTDNNTFIVYGVKPLRWVQQTPFDNDEAVGYLADRLAKLGIEEELIAQGAIEGSTVSIGNWSFDFEPSIATSTHIPRAGRGTDIRLESNERIGSDERKAARKARRESAIITSHHDSAPSDKH